MNYTLKTWLYRWISSEFTIYTLAYIKAEKFLSTWLIYLVLIATPGLLKINCESHLALY